MKQKLIDADELVAKADCSVEFVSYDNTTYIPYVDYVDEICRAPTVEAIPIEWLKQWEEKHKNDPCYCGFVSEEIIKDWKKENEIDDLLPNCVKHAKVMKEIENQLEDRNGKQ